MGAPWRVNRFRLLMLRDSHPEFAPGAWDEVEAYLGTKLPTDYKELIGAGETLVLDDELYVPSPFSRGETLFDLHTEMGDIEARLHFESPDWSPFPVYPEPGGLLCWGSCGGGGIYWWETGAASPDAWPVVVTGRGISSTLETGELVDHERHALPMSEYLAGLVAGTVKAAALGGWPRPGAALDRVAPPAHARLRSTPSASGPVELTLEIALTGALRPAEVDTSAMFEPGLSLDERRRHKDDYVERFRAACRPVDDVIELWAIELASTEMTVVNRQAWRRLGSRDDPFHTDVLLSFPAAGAEAARAAVVSLLGQLDATLVRADDAEGNAWWSDLVRGGH